MQSVPLGCAAQVSRLVPMFWVAMRVICEVGGLEGEGGEGAQDEGVRKGIVGRVWVAGGAASFFHHMSEEEALVQSFPAGAGVGAEGQGRKLWAMEPMRRSADDGYSLWQRLPKTFCRRTDGAGNRDDDALFGL